MTTNFGKVSSDYAKYRDRLPQVLFEQLKGHGIHLQGSTIIELGSGTGIFSRDLALQGGHVIGIEPSQSLIDEALKGDSENSEYTIDYIKGKAEEVILQQHYPIVIAVRAWHWFEREKVLQNIRKYLKHSGLLIIIHSIFLPNSSVAKKTFSVLHKNLVEMKPAGSLADAKERINGMPAQWFEEWREHSFELLHAWQHDYELSFTHEAWCGKIKSVSWMTNTDEATRARVTKELLEELKNCEKLLNVPHQYSVVILKKNA
ncbi:class I SAM-dependent methyltransferase [Paenibacillus daejeonensis]|uniref:class I SAM-dependent methyltransferase n=1 Tax=Paenibacillus daejeonensis TaxID=135193 RepID=UPI000371F05E|nr:class I SAM-dependent methyltransferase [Paenibacillus daejeonensis]